MIIVPYPYSYRKCLFMISSKFCRLVLGTRRWTCQHWVSILFHNYHHQFPLRSWSPMCFSSCIAHFFYYSNYADSRWPLTLKNTPSIKRYLSWHFCDAHTIPGLLSFSVIITFLFFTHVVVSWRSRFVLWDSGRHRTVRWRSFSTSSRLTLPQ